MECRPICRTDYNFKRYQAEWNINKQATTPNIFRVRISVPSTFDNKESNLIQVISRPFLNMFKENMLIAVITGSALLLDCNDSIFLFDEMRSEIILSDPLELQWQ